MGFSEAVIWEVWAKGDISSGDPLMWRKDLCGAWIFRGDYGNKNSEYGWEVDYIIPVSEGGADNISNLRPMHCENNARRENGSIICRITADGAYNIKRLET